jgi:non-specific serine/threonine protein kinase
MIGKTISHYKILEKLGEGGMGVVYKAEDTRLRRTVALKFLPPDMIRDDEARERFAKEAQAASTLQHNNICTIYEIEETGDGRMFIAMAFYEGDTLRNKIEKGPLKLEEAIRIVIQISEGLNKAHEKGIVHRDIKPANLFITNDGVVKILDFGLAKLTGRTRLTKTGTSLGTVTYMSPEQAEGKRIDHRTDIWSLGVILYEMITGRLPFQGDYEQAVVYSILNDEPEPLTGLRSGIPLALERVVTKAMKKNPGQRYQHLDELLVDLNNPEIRESSSAGSSRQTYPSRLKIWSLAGGILGIAALILIFIFNILPILKTQSERRPMIVVLPFENLGPPEHTYFADGVTEEITSRLAACPELGVISRTSAYQYKDPDMSAKKIGRELGVDYILEGTVRWDQAEGFNGRVRVTPQLIRVSDDTHVWADRYDRLLEDIFQVQSEIAEQVIKQMGVQLLARQKGPPDYPTQNMEAYQAYLRGLDFTGVLEYSKEDRLLQIQMLERAVSLDPGFALAYAQLSMVHSRFVMYGMDTSPQRIDKARQSLEKAFALNPGLPEAYLAKGYYHYWCFRDYENALAAFRIAGQKLPNDNRVLAAIAYILRRQGYWKESLTNLEKAFELDPKSPTLARNIGVNLINLREYRQSIAYFDRSIALAPDQQAAYVFKSLVYAGGFGDLKRARQSLEAMPEIKTWFYYYYWMTQELYERNYQKALELLSMVTVDVFEAPDGYEPKSMYSGLIYRCMGDTVRSRRAYEEARLLLESRIEKEPEDFRTRATVGRVYAALGYREKAIKEAEYAVTLLPVTKDAMHGPTMLLNLSEVYIHTGEIEKALEQIKILLELDCIVSPAYFYIDPAFVQITEHPRFKELEKTFKR